MEQSNERSTKDKRNFYELYDGFKSFVSTFLGVIVAIIGIILVFVITSLEGTKEIKASKKENAILMMEWRNNNQTTFPENRVDIISYEGIEYYFVVEKFSEEGIVEEWYFAYEGGFGYIFTDYKFYILTGITLLVSIFVSQINYTTSVNSTKATNKFLKTLLVYQKSKERISNKSHYLPMFCSYKNKQMYEDSKQEIVENANIPYEFYNSKEFDIKNIEDWQRKELDKIKGIKIERITQSDLLQEKSKKMFSSKKSLLPIAPEKHKRNYLYTSFFSKFLSSILTGLTVALGIVIGNWVLGITYGFTVLVSFITANITGADYANSGLRQRYIAKADLLDEFHNMIDYFVEQEKELAKKEVNRFENSYPLLVVNKK